MDAAYNDALAFVLRWEGGFVDDPNDHGGRTMKGVTQNVYNAWRSSQGLPAADVKNISNAEVSAIYQNNYWKKALCNMLKSNIDLVQFDTAVNMGPVRAVKVLQQALGVGVDGNFGQETQRACDACNPPDPVARYCSIREALYRRFAEAPGQDRTGFSPAGSTASRPARAGRRARLREARPRRGRLRRHRPRRTRAGHLSGRSDRCVAKAWLSRRALRNAAEKGARLKIRFRSHDGVAYGPLRNAALRAPWALASTARVFEAIFTRGER